MNSELFKSQWPQIRGVIRDKWSNLTEDDIRQINGQYDLFVSKIQQRYGLTREEAEDQLNIWCSEKGFRGHREFAHAENQSYKWLVLAGIPLLLAAGYFLHDLTKPAERTFAKPMVLTQNMPFDNAQAAMVVQRVRDTIKAGNLPATFQNISVEMSDNGTLILKGTVPSEQEKQMISNIIKRIDGVGRIDNQITTESPSANQMQ